MEYRRRYVNNIFDEENPPCNRSSYSILDDEIYEHNNYKYNGIFNSWRTVYYGIKNIICPCLRKYNRELMIK